MTTGFLGTPYVLHALSRFGYLEEAYSLLTRRAFPSWFYPLERGATTIWERWDGIKPDGSFQDPSMNSFNHYAYGAVGEWMYRVLGGIESEEPGYKRVRLEPRPGGGFTFVKVKHDGPYGPIGCEWHLDGQQFSLTVDIPPNSTASVRLPHAQLNTLTESGLPLAQARGIERVNKDEEGVTADIGSGRYTFVYPWKSTMD